MQGNDKERAKQIIVEIIRQSGGEFYNKTNMYKAFWKAHLEYAKANPGFLSTWPIVRMPNGPGIDRFDVLIDELKAVGVLKTDSVGPKGYESVRFALQGFDIEPEMSAEARAAIKAGVDFVRDKSAASVSNESHLLSSSWNAARNNGDELNIYVDLLSPEEFEAKKRKMRLLAAAFDGPQGS